MKQTHVQYKEHVQETEYIDLNGVTFQVALHSLSPAIYHFNHLFD